LTKTLRTTKALLLSLLTAAPALAGGPKDAGPIYDPLTDGVRAIEAGARYCTQSGRRLILNLGTNDCAPCRVVNSVMQEPRFNEAMVNDFLPVFIDVTPGSKNAELLNRFGVKKKKALPVIVVFDADMKPAEVTGNGEMAALAKKGGRDVELWFLARFPKSVER